MANHPSTVAGSTERWLLQLLSPLELLTDLCDVLFPAVGWGLVIIGTVTGTLRHQKTNSGKDPAGHFLSWLLQAQGTLAGSFALMLHLFWDKTGCRYHVQATWHYYNHLENINRIKSCRDFSAAHSPGCRSTRDFIPVANTATWSGGPALALGTEGCSAAVTSMLQLLTPRDKFGHCDTGDLQSPSGCY